MNAINKNTFRHRWLSIAKNFKFLPEKQFVKILYECYTARRLDLDHPKTFNQKLQWYKVFYKDPLFTTLVDKYEVRSFVKEKVGDTYLNTLYGVYTTPSEIDFESLPNQFVIKGTHGCAMNLIVKDKATLDRKKAIKTMNKWLQIDYYQKGKEWAYKNVIPRLTIEAFMENPGEAILTDYKIYCFQGKPAFIQIHYGRGVSYGKCFYSTEWEQLDFHKNTSIAFLEDTLPEPSNLKEMLEIASTLATDIPFVRVDLYSVQEKTIFGEMTFYPSNGLSMFYPDKMNYTIGDLFKLPEKKLEVPS